MANTVTNLETLKINYLKQYQYEAAVANNLINDNELYLTPTEDITINLNGENVTDPVFYAPTTAGTDGYYLKSNGSGAPTWAAITTTDDKVSQTATTTSSLYEVLFSGTADNTTRTEGARKANSLKFNPSSHVLGIVHPDLDKTIAPSANTSYGYFSFLDTNNKTVGQIRNVQLTDKSNCLYFSVNSCLDDSTHNALLMKNAADGTVTLTAYGNFTAPKVYGAVWNDYAEFRQSDQNEPGRVVIEKGDDTLVLSTGRLQPGAEIISDTYGFAIGETDNCKTPIAASGRVLAYPFEDRDLFKQYIGAPVCSGPNGTVSIMTEEEEQKYPSRIIGTISAVPDYEEWGTGKVKVNGRVWIRIR